MGVSEINLYSSIIYQCTRQQQIVTMSVMGPGTLPINFTLTPNLFWYRAIAVM